MRPSDRDRRPGAGTNEPQAANTTRARGVRDEVELSEASRLAAAEERSAREALQEAARLPPAEGVAPNELPAYLAEAEAAERGALEAFVEGVRMRHIDELA